MENLVKNKDQCCGCSACMSICPTQAISMKADEEGFLYPFINETSCTNCGLCEKVCDFKRCNKVNYELPLVYSARHKNDDVLSKSASGGMFTALSDVILSNKGIVYAAGYNGVLSISHRDADSSLERDRMRGSIYVQSEIGRTFIKAAAEAAEGKQILFVGTPCQSVGLRNYLTSKGQNMSNVYIVGLICHGVSSPMVWRDYIKWLQQKHSFVIERVSFRDKRVGWSHPTMVASGNGKEISIAEFGKIFGSDVCLRPSCHVCPYASVRRGIDISIGDYWGIQQAHPDFYDERGVSLVLVHSQNGRSLLNKCQHSLNLLESNTDKCLQLNLKQATNVSPLRESFWRDYRSKDFSYIVRKYGQDSFTLRVKRKLKKIVGR